MDDADVRGEPVVSATGGVTLQKRLDTREFDRPTVVYELDSQRDTAVDVRLIEPIPAALEPADIGFLGAADGPSWEIKGPKLVFEHRLDVGGSYRTGIAARGDRAGAVTDLLEAPEVLDVDRAPPRRDGDSTGSAEPLVERLVAELRDGASTEAVAALRAELGSPPANRPSLETRLAQLQADVADVRAYSNAMEGFLDEHGPADEVIDRLVARLDDLEERLGALETEVATRDDAREARVADLEAEVDRIEGEVPNADVDARLESVESDLAEISEFTTSLKAAFRQ